eukprot:2521118-Lingulodinium_polyedra.AAC.1
MPLGVAKKQRGPPPTVPHSLRHQRRGPAERLGAMPELQVQQIARRCSHELTFGQQIVVKQSVHV